MRAPFGTRQVRRREDVSPARALLRGVAVTAFIALAAFLVLRASTGLPFMDRYELQVKLDDAGSLRAGSGVDIAGKRVGRVLDKRAGDDGQAIVKIQLGSSVDPLPEDTTARVRAQGLLGARFLELTPGDAEQPLDSGDTIRGGEITNGLPEAIAAFDAKTRDALERDVDAMGRGLADRGEQLNEALGWAPDVVADAGAVSDAVLARPGAAGRLLPSMASGMSAFDAAGDDIARGVGPGADALQPFVDRRGATRETIAEAPLALSAVDEGLSVGRRLLAAARTLSVAASDTLPAAPEGLRNLRALLREGRDPVRRAAPLVTETGRTVPSVLALTRRLKPVLAPVEEGLADLRAPVREVARRRCDLDNFAENWRSMLGYGVKGGGEIGPLNSIRFEAIGSNESLAGMGPAAKDLYLPNGFAVSNAYPEPCRYSPGPPYNFDRALTRRPQR